MAKNATNIILKIGAKELVGELNHSINSTVDVIDGSSKKSARISRKLPGRVSENISFESLADDTSTDYGYSDAHTAMKAGTKIGFSIVRDLVTIKTGNGYIASLTKDNPDNDRSTFSGTIEVTGALT